MKRHLHIVFLLPCNIKLPSGGIKIVLEYANFLACNGYSVEIVTPPTVLWWRQALKEKLKSIPRYFAMRLMDKYHHPRWFDLDSRVCVRIVPVLSQLFVPKANVYIATSAETALYAMKYQTKARKAYLIQDYEDWNVSKKELLDTYRYPFKKLVISNWLREIVNRESGEPTVLIPNGFDLDCFGVDVPLDVRGSHTVAFLYHERPTKGVDVGMNVLFEAKRRVPDLKVEMFGVYAAPKGLPEWINYHRSPSKAELRSIYNKAAVYLACSRTEGWGLTVGEAMLCGCAVCCTSCNGFLEMVTDGQTGLTAPIDDIDALVENLCSLLSDSTLRIDVAKRGCLSMRKFDWEISKRCFLKTIQAEW